MHLPLTPFVRRRGAISARNLLVSLGIVLALAAGAVVYGKLKTASADRKNLEVSQVPTAMVDVSDLEQSVRISGTIAAERFNGLLAPQLAGNRSGQPGGGGGGGSSSSGSSSNSSSSNTASSTSSSSASSSTSTASSPSASTNTANSSASATGANSSLGAIRGTQNRFSDRTAASSATSSSSATSPSSSSSSNSNSGTSGTGSTASSLPGNQGGGGGGGGGDFMLVLINVTPAGNHVRKGEIVAEFDRTSQLTRLDNYKDSVIQQDANLKKMKADQAVARESHEQQIRSAKADLDKAELDLKTAPVRSAIESEILKLAVEEAKAHYEQILGEVKLFDESQRAALRAAEITRDQSKIELQRAERNIDRMVMRAPMDGVAVMQSIFRGGDFGQVQKGDQLYPGMMFMQIIDPTSMVLGAVVNQVDAEAIRLGMKAAVRLDAYPGLVLPAHVIGIGAMTKPGVWRPNYMREIPVRLKLDAVDARVIPDISASADIQLALEKQVNVAPLGAVFYDKPDSRPFVFLRNPAGWERRDVELGTANNVAVVIRSGAAKGDVLAAEKP